jgi:hypothetical protein
MEKILISLLLILCQICSIGQTVNYTESNEIIANPERGLQKYSITGSNYSTNNGANNLSVSTLSNWRNSADKITVVYRYFLLEDFMDSNINTTYLNNIQGDFDNIRAAGLKVIVRFSYSNSEGNGAQQPSKAQILSHISQLSSILNNNKDVIFSIQAGFIGTWGEWYYTNSSEFGTEDDITNVQWSNRKEVVDAMLSTVPLDIPVQVRYVGIKTKLYGLTTLTPQTAYQNTANARIGFYNDAFLNDWGDQGTYSVNDQCDNPVGNSEYNYLSNETKYLPMTGETNGLNSCNNGFRTNGINAIHEMELTNWTTLNRDYHPAFWNQIINSNEYDDILKKLGYRFVLNSSTVTSNGLDFDLTINLTNIGFARIFKKRNVYLVMKNTQTNNISTHLINTDIRTWENSNTISQNIDSGLTGSYQLYLWMPDNSPLLETNSDYSIRFANQNIWDAATGYNDLMQTVDLSCTSSSGTDTRAACNSYTWIDGITYTSSNNTATYNIIGGAENGCDSLVTLDLTIFNVSDITIITSGNTITANNNNASYQWLDCADDYSVIDGEIDASFTSLTNGEYAVELTENTCQDTSACVTITSVGIIENGYGDPFIIYPNPSSDYITMQFKHSGKETLQIFDLLGHKVLEKAVSKDQRIDVSYLSDGIYNVRIKSQQSTSSKFVKQ